MNPALRTDARLLRLLSPEAMPAQPRADWHVRLANPMHQSCSPVCTHESLYSPVYPGASGLPRRSQSATGRGAPSAAGWDWSTLCYGSSGRSSCTRRRHGST